MWLDVSMGNGQGTTARSEDFARNAHGIARRTGTSFYWAMRFLPEPQRSSMFAVYAFCRAVDDIADGHASTTAKISMLDDYRLGIRSLFRNEPVRLSAVANLSDPISRYGLHKSDFLGMIDGMATDAPSCVRMADRAALNLYIDRVAGTVGRLSCRVFGLPEAVHAPLSAALGTAFQITNILRDLREDAARDRIYLPADDLAAYGIDSGDAAVMVGRCDLAPVCASLVDQARQSFTGADRLIEAHHAASFRPVRMMRAAYGRLFDKVAEAGFSPIPKNRIRLGRTEKLAIALRHGLT